MQSFKSNISTTYSLLNLAKGTPLMATLVSFFVAVSLDQTIWHFQNELTSTPSQIVPGSSPYIPCVSESTMVAGAARSCHKCIQWQREKVETVKSPSIASNSTNHPHVVNKAHTVPTLNPKLAIFSSSTQASYKFSNTCKLQCRRASLCQRAKCKVHAASLST